KNEKFINTLFLDIFPFNHNYLLEFMYCYQIIEFSIDELQKKKHSSLLKEIKKYNKEPRKINELVRTISSMLKEDTRISKINEIISSHVDLANLKISCNKLLAKYNREEGNYLHEYLYGVRNLLIHEFRIVENLNELEIIVLYFKEFIVSLISIYNEDDEDINIKQKTFKKNSKRKNKKYLKNR
uniref:hypothetical protein n=1 Tax=Aliarcobacter butzleri TaxID=28197 RepID=UPI001D005C6B